MAFREESDSLGMVRVPENAYYGASTQRAVDNFRISGITLPVSLLRALGLIKKCCAEVNAELGLLDVKLAAAIGDAAREILDGRLDSSFVVDVFQTGSGTSTHMNVNEVIASRANEMLTGKRGGKSPVHPNDHVNLGQSSNDVFPSAMNISALMEISEPADSRAGKAAGRIVPEGRRIQGYTENGANPSSGCRPHDTGAGVFRICKTGGTGNPPRSLCSEQPL